MQQTVDGYTEGPNGEFDWPIVLPETNGYFNAKARELGVVLMRHERVR